mgnify:CR=1 FL=1|tara:strand:- start:32392 stop:32853 length:462 start_codon:yes stop_codon:yes gene_type:complete
MKKNYENLPYEFLLLINKKPIVGRNFQVKGFNKDSLSSIELKELIDDVVLIIQNQFKAKSRTYLWRYYNPYLIQNTEEVDESKKDIYENEDIFTLQIKIKGRVVAQKMFSGNDYPPKVRYDVDIRSIISEIISKIQNGLSLENYTQEYCGYTL